MKRPWWHTLIIWGLRAGFAAALMGIAWFESVSTILVSAVLLSGFFCAIACPWGSISDAISTLGRVLLGKRRRWFAIPQRWHRVLGLARWLILAEVIVVVAADPALRWFAGPERATEASPYLAWFVVAQWVALLGAALFVDRFFCRYLCFIRPPLALLSRASPLRLERQSTALCAHCARCERACPMAVRVRDKAVLQGSDCMTCLACVAVCPAKPPALSLRLFGRDVSRLGEVGFALAASGVFVALTLVAAALHVDAHIPL